MAIYGVEAQYNPESPIDDAGHPARLKIASRYSLAVLHLSDEDYRAVARALEDFTGDHVLDATYIEGGSISISTAPPSADDDWQSEIVQGSLETTITVDAEEVRKAEKVMKDPHPAFEDYPDVNRSEVEVSN